LSSLPPPNSELVDELVVANKILYKYGVVDGFGHISVRHDADPDHFLMAHHLAPPLVTAADIHTFDLEGQPLDDVPGRRYYSERFIHSEVYKLRPDVVSVIHSHALPLIPFAATKQKLLPMYHMSAFLGKGPPVFDIRKKGGITNMLVRTPELGNALAEKLGPAPVVLMRGHGATMVGGSIRAAVYRAIYAMQNAVAQQNAIALAGKDVTYLDPREADLYERYSGEVMHRPWNMWRAEALGEI
jgi:ribulose-5-phosphate 4-epimerase/fuculose-1-phosphate aldolase